MSASVAPSGYSCRCWRGRRFVPQPDGVDLVPARDARRVQLEAQAGDGEVRVPGEDRDVDAPVGAAGLETVRTLFHEARARRRGTSYAWSVVMTPLETE